jgi:mannosyltransferase OCH1-like enzyme
MNQTIHQVFWVFKNGQPLEEIAEYRDNVEATQKLCKIHNYEYKLWGLKQCEKLVYQEFPEYIDLWNNFRHEIQRVDFIRYCILYQFGGLYIDCDIRPVKNLDSVFKDKLFFVHWSNDEKKLPYNAVMGSHQGQELFLHILKECERSYEEKSKMEIYDTWKGRFIFQTTGHHMLERVVKKQKISKKKYFHDCLYIDNPDKKGMSTVGEMNKAIFLDNNASVWFENLI